MDDDIKIYTMKELKSYVKLAKRVMMNVKFGPNTHIAVLEKHDVNRILSNIPDSATPRSLKLTSDYFGHYYQDLKSVFIINS